MRLHLATLVVFGALAGCAASTEEQSTNEPIDESQSALTNHVTEARELAPFETVTEQDKIANPVDRPVSVVTHSGRPPHTPQGVNGLRNP